MSDKESRPQACYPANRTFDEFGDETAEEVLRNSKKTIARFSASNYPRYPKNTTEGGLLISRHENMKNFRAHERALLVLSTALFCLCPQFGYADGEPLESASGSGDVPTEKLGTGVFARFPVRISFFARGGYDDNVGTSVIEKQGSWFTSLGGALTYEFGSPRTQISLGTNAGFTYYFDQPTNTLDDNSYDPNLNLTLSLTHKASPRLTLSLSMYLAYQAEPDFSIGVGANRRTGNFFYTQNSFSVSYVWAPRFSTRTNYSLGTIRYDDSAVGFFEDRVDNSIGNEFRFLMLPTTSLIAEYRFQVVTYDEISRDSTSHFFLGGVDHRFSPRLSANFRSGLQIRDSDEISSRASPYFESTVGYILGKDTSVSWTNRYGIEESDVLFNPSRKTFRTGLQLTRTLTPRINGSLSAYYTHDDYDGITIPPITVVPSFTENAFDTALALRYAVTRYFSLEAGFAHTEVSSDLPLRDYSRNRFWGGLNLSF